jgi:hypothetical protein
MATKFQDLITTKKLDARRIIAASQKLEKLHREDRAIRLAQRKARRSEDKKKEGLATQKPRTGRPVTQPAIDAALAGKELAGPVKTRLLRAVNHLLEQKKQEPMKLADLFEMPKKGLPKKEKKAKES